MINLPVVLSFSIFSLLLPVAVWDKVQQPFQRHPFQAEQPRIDARIVCTIRIGQIVVIALAFGVGFLKQKMHSKQARATRAKTAPAAQERKVSNG